MQTDLLPIVLDALIGGLNKTGGLAVQREPGNDDHIVATPPMTRADLVQWLFAGRHDPTERRLRPDPVVGTSTDPQARFLFRPTPADTQYLRSDFRERWFDSGPGWFIVEVLPDWVPQATKDQIVALDRSGALRRSVAPVVRVFPGAPPFGDIVFWYGKGDFTYEIQVYQEFPDSPDFYASLKGGAISERDARILHHVYTTWNKDVRYFVVEKGMSPEDARIELRRIWGEIFKQVLEAASTIVASGAAVSGMNKLSQAADGSVQAALDSFRAKRQLFSLWARNKSVFQILFRGATFKKIARDVLLNLEHDLGAGTYFTTVEKVAEKFARGKASPGDEGVMLRLVVRDKAELGNTLDLVDGPLAEEWRAHTAPVLAVNPRVVNETYNNMFNSFLKSKGLNVHDFDTIVAEDFLNGGTQLCIRNDDIAARLLELADEVPLLP